MGLQVFDDSYIHILKTFKTKLILFLTVRARSIIFCMLYHVEGLQKAAKVLKVWDLGSKFVPNKPFFLLVCNTSLLKTLWEKEKLLVTSNFSFSYSVFLSFGQPSSIFIKRHLKTLSVWKSLEFVIWERVKLIGLGLLRNPG